MQQPPAPRLGCVRCLNSRPLIHGHADAVSFEVPARLADGLRSRRLDVARVSIAHAGELADLRTLYLAGASRWRRSGWQK